MSLASQDSLSKKIPHLKERSHMLMKARSFFYERGLYEVDTPLLSYAASQDEHIDLINVSGGRYLVSSPEYAMKRLLAHGSGDIFQLSHVFREGEVGFKHQPEFTMAEWYRLNFTFEEMIEETLNFIRLFVGEIPSVNMSYRTLFQKFINLDPFYAEPSHLGLYLKREKIDFPPSIESDKDALLNLILALAIEPKLPSEELFVVTHYPGAQAALAKKIPDPPFEVAERFEVYYRGFELANGYHELLDPKEQRIRCEESNALRLKLGKDPLPLDERFLEALEKGLPECSGVAVGFDRLMMLRLQKNRIDEVIPISYAEGV